MFALGITLDLTFNSHSYSFGDISYVIPGLACIGAHVVCASILNYQVGLSIFIFLHHIVSPVIIPDVFGPWVRHRGALQPRLRAKIDLRVF